MKSVREKQESEHLSTFLLGRLNLIKEETNSPPVTAQMHLAAKQGTVENWQEASRQAPVSRRRVAYAR